MNKNKKLHELSLKLLMGQSISKLQLSHGDNKISFYRLINYVRTQTAIPFKVVQVSNNSYIVPTHGLEKYNAPYLNDDMFTLMREAILAEELHKHEMNYNEVKI